MLTEEDKRAIANIVENKMPNLFWVYLCLTILLLRGCS
jgi:hypothetical protein